MACILLWSSAVRVHDSQTYTKMDMTRKCISRSYLGAERNTLVNPNWFQPCQCCSVLSWRVSQAWNPHQLLLSPGIWSLWLAKSRPVYSLMLSFHLFFCLLCLFPPFAVPCKIVSARHDERETWPYHCSLRLFMIVRRSSCGPVACWILARTSSLVTWSLYEMCSIRI